MITYQNHEFALSADQLTALFPKNDGTVPIDTLPRYWDGSCMQVLTPERFIALLRDTPAGSASPVSADIIRTVLENALVNKENLPENHWRPFAAGKAHNLHFNQNNRELDRVVASIVEAALAQ